VTAQYLLRFDDLCPTMDRKRWERFLPLIRGYGIRPILAIVPENRDPDLVVGPEDAGFWDEMRSMQSAGAAIGLHGFRHVCAAQGSGLIPLHAQTEFAGVQREVQREWIRAGVEILRGQGLEPRIWVAPRHGFDWVTLEVLREEGIELLSDGFAARPFRWGEMTWIPQQLWEPVEKASGLWTICIHANSATDESVVALEDFLKRNGSRFTSVERVEREWPIAERSVGDRIFHARMMWRIRLSRLARRFRSA
jgi:predicted deacetylase